MKITHAYIHQAILYLTIMFQLSTSMNSILDYK